MLSAEQVEEYRTRGFVTVPGVFSEVELDPVDRYLRRYQDVTWEDKNDDPLREPHYHCAPIYAMCTAPALLDVIEQLLGPDLVLLYSHIMSKKPGGMRVAWHQDGPYWHRVDPKIAVTAWIALDDATVENGCMRVIPGSQQGHRDLGQRLVDTPDLIQTRPYELPPEVVNDSNAVDVVMHRGDLSLHDSYIVHGSEPNRSNGRRAALTVRYLPAAARIQDTADRRQFLVRGRAVDNGNVYYSFGDVPAAMRERVAAGVPPEA